MVTDQILDEDRAKGFSDAGFGGTTRRQFLRNAMGFSALLLGSMTAAEADAYNDLFKAMMAASQAQDFVGVERLVRYGLQRFGEDEGLLRMLSFALWQQNRNAEAIQVATHNAQKYPCIWSKVGLAEAYLHDGDFDRCRTVLRALAKERDQWRNAERKIASIDTHVAIKEFALTFNLSREKAGPKRDEVCIAMPPKHGVQHDVKLEVKRGGVIIANEENSEIGNRWIRVKFESNADIVVAVNVTILPMSYKKLLAKFDPQPLPPSLKLFLGKSVGKRPHYYVDPYSDTARRAAEPLRGQNHPETLANIQKWFNTHFRDKAPAGWVQTEPDNSDKVLQRGYSGCTGVGLAVCAVCRHLGIPARLIRGHSAMHEDSAHLCQHTIPEAYLHGVGWIDFDSRKRNLVWAPRLDFFRRFRFVAPWDCYCQILKVFDSIELPDTGGGLRLVRKYF